MLLRLYQTDMSLPVAHETGDIRVFSFFAGSSSISYSCCTLLAASTFISWLAGRQAGGTSEWKKKKQNAQNRMNVMTTRIFSNPKPNKKKENQKIKGKKQETKKKST